MAFKIYTRTGDGGKTGLIGGQRVSKDAVQIEAYGTVDELNAFIGLAKDQCDDEELQTWLLEIQNDLFVIGSQLAVSTDKSLKQKLPDFDSSRVTWLEERIDETEEHLPQMKFFVLPGGDISASNFHVARTVCRRAERRCISLQALEIIPLDEVVKYLNRLSDFLFVISRLMVKKAGKEEIFWKPKV